jgi:hypothetical protein
MAYDKIRTEDDCPFLPFENSQNMQAHLRSWAQFVTSALATDFIFRRFGNSRNVEVEVESVDERRMAAESALGAEHDRQVGNFPERGTRCEKLDFKIVEFTRPLTQASRLTPVAY